MKALITDLITRLHVKSSSETSHKSYCDEEMQEIPGEMAISTSTGMDGEGTELRTDLCDVSEHLKIDARRVDDISVVHQRQTSTLQADTQKAVARQQHKHSNQQQLTRQMLQGKKRKKGREEE